MKQIPVEFEFEGVKYSHTLEVKESEVDFWTAFYNEKDGKELNFDVHYCEEYNSISVYPIDMETLETDYSDSLVTQPIFTKMEYFERFPSEDESFMLQFLNFKAE